jgi:hypothetical protein
MASHTAARDRSSGLDLLSERLQRFAIRSRGEVLEAVRRADT